MREPARGQSEGLSVDGAPGLRIMLRFFAKQRSMTWIYIAIPTVGMAMSVLATWTIPFLMRRYGIDIAMAGLMLGLLLSLGMGVGSVVTSQIADRLGRRSARHRIIFSCTCLALAVPALWVGYSTDMLWLSVTALAFSQVFFASFIAPIIGLITMLCRPNMRGAAMSTRDMLANFVGFGVGPFLAGLISAAIGGPEALRSAILITTLGGTIIGVAMLILAARTVNEDVLRACSVDPV